VILGFFARKSHNMIGHVIFHGDLNFFLSLNCPSLRSVQFRDQKSLDLHEKFFELSYCEIFPQKILKSRTFKKCGALIVIIDSAPSELARIDSLR